MTHPPSGPSTPTPPPGPKTRPYGHLPIGAGQLPTLGMIIRDGEHLCQQLINLLGRDYDPASVAAVEAWPGMLLADLELARLKSDVRQVLRGLADLAGLRHPPAGSAVAVDFQDHLAPPLPPGEGLLPGLAAADPDPTAARQSDDDGLVSVRAGDSSDPRPHLSQRAPKGNGVRPGVGS